MSMTSIGDLARNFVLTRKNAQIKSNATTLVEELSSGRVKNLSRHLGGDFSHLSGVTHAQNLNAAYAQSAKEAGLISEAMQLALGKIETEIDGSRSELLTIAAAPSDHSVSQRQHRPRTPFHHCRSAQRHGRRPLALRRCQHWRPSRCKC